jgi:3-phenylpropionate/trans-cinnamate dioxygenase ferredoxin reductase subunit
VTAPTIVVGAGLAGVRTVQALRRRGYDAPVILVGAEAHLPYDRPPLSKEFLLGKVGVDDIALCGADELANLGVELRLRTRAFGVDPAARTLQLSGDSVRYGTLVVGTGSTPRTLPVAGGHAGVHTFRTLDDAVAVRDALAAGARVAVVGGGFIGSEIASAARHLGLDVTIVDPLPVLMMRGLGPSLGAVLARRHADNGVRMRLGRGVARIDGGERVERLVLDDGASVDADLVVVGIGVAPAIGWLAGSGLDITSGLSCDATLHAGADIYGVGDAASWSTPHGRHRTEHWTNAVDQAAALAATLTGKPTAFDPLPYVWSDQLGGKLQVWGEVRPGDELVYLDGNADSAEFVAVSGGDGRLRGVVAFGARREAMRAMRMLRAGAGWQPGSGPRQEPEPDK